MIREIQKNHQLIARLLRPRPQQVVSRPGLSIYEDTLNVVHTYAPHISGHHSLRVATAVVDLSQVEVFPLINDQMRYGFFYTPEKSQKKLNLNDFAPLAASRGMPSEKLLMVTPGNSNLFTNFAYWAKASARHTVTGQDIFLSHFQEVLAKGQKQNALIIEAGQPSIKTVDPFSHECKATALGAVKIMHQGQALELDQKDPGTGRESFIDTHFDLQQFIWRPTGQPDLGFETAIKNLCLDPTTETFDPAQIANYEDLQRFYPGWDNKKFMRRQDLDPELKALLNQVQRSTYNHMLFCTTDDSNKIVLFGIFPQTLRQKGQGLRYEDVPLVAIELANQIGLGLKDAIVLCNGSEPFIKTDQYQIASFSKLDQNLTSGLLFYQR